MRSKFSDTSRHFGRVAAALLNSGAREATLYLSPTLTVRATRPLYRAHGKVEDRRASRADVHFTAGAPNYRSRQFIKKCLRVGEPFPVRKIQLRFAPGAAG